MKIKSIIALISIIACQNILGSQKKEDSYIKELQHQMNLNEMQLPKEHQQSSFSWSYQKFLTNMKIKRVLWSSWQAPEYSWKDIDGNTKTMRQDTKSPYYQHGHITQESLNRYSTSRYNEKLTKSNRQSLEFYAWYLNAKENAEYHTELQFLETQQAKCELYWDTKPWYTKIFSYFSYRKQQNLLTNEIELFKKNRETFTRSSMPEEEFDFVTELRSNYAQQNPSKE